MALNNNLIICIYIILNIYLTKLYVVLTICMYNIKCKYNLNLLHDSRNTSSSKKIDNEESPIKGKISFTMSNKRGQDMVVYLTEIQGVI